MDDIKIVNESDPEWTQHDTDICERGEASGTCVWLNSNEPVRFNELKSIASHYDKFRNEMDVDEFMELIGIGKQTYKWEERHYKMVEESERMIKENKQGKVIDI